MARVLESARERADDVIVAAPPLDQPASALGLATLCDAILVVVRERATTRDEARAARAALMATTTPVVGIALAREPARRRLPQPLLAARARRRGGWRRSREKMA
jgi:Mrp family chromosome partitioning ATPase